jgi:hypothetical protein
VLVRCIAGADEAEDAGSGAVKVGRRRAGISSGDGSGLPDEVFRCTVVHGEAPPPSTHGRGSFGS